MMTREEVLGWVRRLPAGSGIAIDQGGLTLRQVEDRNNYCEVGGTPEECPNCHTDMDEDGFCEGGDCPNNT